MILIKIKPLSLRSIIKAIVIWFYLRGNVQQRTYDVISVNEFQIDRFKLNQEWKRKGKKKITKQSRHSREQKVVLFLLLSEHSHARIHSHQSYRICISVRNQRSSCVIILSLWSPHGFMFATHRANIAIHYIGAYSSVCI